MVVRGWAGEGSAPAGRAPGRGGTTTAPTGVGWGGGGLRGRGSGGRPIQEPARQRYASTTATTVVVRTARHVGDSCCYWLRAPECVVVVASPCLSPRPGCVLLPAALLLCSLIELIG